MTAHRFNTGKSQSDPRYKTPAQTGRKMNPIYQRILAVAKKIGWPEYYKRDLVIDKSSITRNHPSAVIFGIRDTGTELVNLKRGVRASSPKTVKLFGPPGRGREEKWVRTAVDKIEYWSRSGASSPIRWYYITPSSTRSVTPKEAIGIVWKYAGVNTTF
jgi:hypothetical protein